MDQIVVKVAVSADREPHLYATLSQLPPSYRAEWFRSVGKASLERDSAKGHAPVLFPTTPVAVARSATSQAGLPVVARPPGTPRKRTANRTVPRTMDQGGNTTGHQTDPAPFEHHTVETEDGRKPTQASATSEAFPATEVLQDASNAASLALESYPDIQF